MGEARRKKERKAPIKPTEKLDPIPLPPDRSTSEKQKAFCKSLVESVLNDDSCLSFSKPVDQLWDPSVLVDYFEKITRPMDVGTVQKRIASTYVQKDSDLFDPNAFREELRLVFLNAILYNTKSSELGRLASRFLHYIDNELAKIPTPSLTEQPDAAVSDRVDTKKVSSPDSSSKKSADILPKRSSKPTSDQGTDDNDGDHRDDIDDDGEKENSVGGKKIDRPSSSKAKKSEGEMSGDSGDEGELNDSSSNIKSTPKSRDDISKSKGDTDTNERGGENEDDKEPASEKGGPDDNDDDLEDGDQPADGSHFDNDDESDAKDTSSRSTEHEKLTREIASLTKQCANAHGRIAEIELEKNVPLSHGENSKLRDEVESLPWEKAQKVVQILRDYVDEALKDSKESDPEYVTLEFSTVEPRLLREIEALIHPDPRLEKEKAVVERLQRDIETARRKLKRLNETASSERKKKRAKKSR